MDLASQFERARRDETVARLRRVMALRAMAATGMTQREVAERLGVSQPAISQQAKAPRSGDTQLLLEAAGPILKEVAEAKGFRGLAVFGSVARQEAGPQSDIDLLVHPPSGATISDLVSLQNVFETVLGRRVDVVSYGGLSAQIDDDILHDAVAL